MHYLYGSKTGARQRLVATFDSEPQTLAYVNWAKLKSNPDGSAKFEQGSALSGYDHWEHSSSPVTDDDPESVFHNPSPNML